MSVLNHIIRFFSLDWLPEPPHVRLRNLSRDDVMVKSAYSAVMSESAEQGADWVGELVQKMADNCRTELGRDTCLSFLKTHLEHKENKQARRQKRLERNILSL